MLNSLSLVLINLFASLGTLKRILAEWLPYFFGYKTELFFYQNNPNSLGLFRKGKICIVAKFHRADLVICSYSREGKTPS